MGNLEYGFTDEDDMLQDSIEEIHALPLDRLLDEVINIIEAQPPVNHMPNVIRRAPLLETIKQMRRKDE